MAKNKKNNDLQMEETNPQENSVETNQEGKTESVDVKVATNTKDAKAKFEALKAQIQNNVKRLEAKNGKASVDDTMERVERSTKVSKRNDYKPNKGVSAFMAKQNAIYLSQGKTAPYSDECLMNTIEKELA